MAIMTLNLPMVTVPDAWHQITTSAKLYWLLLTEAHEYEQPAQGCYVTAVRLGVKDMTIELQV